MHLTVDIGLGDMIKINQGQRPHTLTSQGFSRPGTDAPNSDNGYLSMTHRIIRSGTKQTNQTTEAALCLAVICLNICLKTVHKVSRGLLNDAFLHDPAKKLLFALDKRRVEEHNLPITP